MSDNEQTIAWLKAEYDHLIAQADALLEVAAYEPSAIRDEDAEHVVWVMACLRNTVRSLTQRAARTHHNLKLAGAERDALKVGDEIARRHADGWHPVFASDSKDSKWVPWNEGEPEELTAEQYEWFQAAWADRHARQAEL